MKKIMSVFAAVLFAVCVFAGPRFTSECVEGWSWIGDKYNSCISALAYSVYSNPNACQMYMAVDSSGNCYTVKFESDGYYVLYQGSWCKLIER